LTVPPLRLCGAGTPGAVLGSGPWTWICAGSNGGVSANCSATAALPNNVVPLPTLSEWLLELLAAILAATALIALYRRMTP